MKPRNVLLILVILSVLAGVAIPLVVALRNRPNDPEAGHLETLRQIEKMQRLYRTSSN